MWMIRSREDGIPTTIRIDGYYKTDSTKLLKLPKSERAALATELIRSLDEAENADAAEAWVRELDKRANDVSSGRAKIVSWTRARKRIEDKLRARHG
jgi:putative addiction module component (TIGR02574 family)